MQAFRTLGHWRAFAWFLLALGFAVSVFGILQHFTFNGKFYWFREMRYGGIPFGPYVNRNHFAGLVELIIPLGVSLLLLRAEERDRLPLLGVLTLMPIGALFLSASRGGIAAFFLELGLLLILAVLRGHAGKQLVAGAVLLLVAGGFVVWLGAGRALDRFASYRKLEVTEARRAEMLRDSWRIFLDHPVRERGLARSRRFFPATRLSTMGLSSAIPTTITSRPSPRPASIGGIIRRKLLALLLPGAWRRIALADNRLDLALHLGAVAACCALLAHSLVDFNLHIPANALIFLTLSGFGHFPHRREFWKVSTGPMRNKRQN